MQAYGRAIRLARHPPFSIGKAREANAPGAEPRATGPAINGTMAAQVPFLLVTPMARVARSVIVWLRAQPGSRIVDRVRRAPDRSPSFTTQIDNETTTSFCLCPGYLDRGRFHRLHYCFRPAPQPRRRYTRKRHPSLARSVSWLAGKLKGLHGQGQRNLRRQAAAASLVDGSRNVRLQARK